MYKRNKRLISLNFIIINTIIIAIIAIITIITIVIIIIISMHELLRSRSALTSMSLMQEHAVGKEKEGNYVL